MNVLSFSLWGPHPIYNIGAIENAKLQKQLLPDWICRYYVGNDSDETTISELEQMGCQIVRKEGKHGFQRLFWRMLPASDKTIERFLIQDCDSRINERVVSAIEDWKLTDKPFMMMRDSVHHSLAIQGGMWGGKGGIIKNIESAAEEYCSQQINTGFKDYYFLDQLFLNQKVWPKIKDHHVAYIGNGGRSYTSNDRSFPVNLPDGQFVGQVWEANNQPASASRINPFIY